MQKYRVALFKVGSCYFTHTQDYGLETRDLADDGNFVKWLTEWIEYDVKELDK